MRPAPAFLIAAALAAATPALAQTGDDGCTRTNPCPWVVDVDDKGFQFYVDEEQTFSQGDWYELLIFNDDMNRSHTISLSEHEVSVTVAADGMSQDTGAFQFTKVGTFKLRDSPTNDEITVHVVEGDAVASETASQTEDEGAPALPFVLLAAALVGLVAWRRR